MLIKQIQFTETTEEENELIPDFLNWVCKQMYSSINTKINRKKIQLRIKYLYEVQWINWTGSEYTDVQTLMETIYKSFYVEEYKNNIWKISIDNNILIPNTTTSISRFVRFYNISFQFYIVCSFCFLKGILCLFRICYFCVFTVLFLGK